MIMKKIDLMNVWNLLNGAKFGKMESKEKIKFVRILCVLKPEADAFTAFRETAVNKLTEEHPDFNERLQKAQDYEKAVKEKATELPMTEQEYKDFVKEVTEFNKAVDSTIKEELEKEVDVKYDRLSDEGFAGLCDSNDFTGEQAIMLMGVLV